MHLSADDWSAIRLTLELASIVTVLLLIIGTPIAWWLARSRSPLRGIGRVISPAGAPRASGMASSSAAAACSTVRRCGLAGL